MVKITSLKILELVLKIFRLVCVFHCVIAYGYDQGSELEIVSVLLKNEPSVVVTDDFSGFSLDPLNGTVTTNIRIMNLLYEKPLKQDKNGFLVSDLLDGFSFDSKSNEVRFLLKKGLKFSDGSDLSIHDVVMAIKRSAFFRSSFPGIAKIAGIREWSKGKQPFASVPEGIKIVDNYKVVIKFSESVINPLEIFANNVFFVIPRRCIHPDSGKLACVQPPSSGKYKLARVKNKLVSFSLWKSSAGGYPKNLNLISIPSIKLIKFLKYYNTNHVMIVEQIYIPPDHMKIMERKIKLNSIPEFRFMAINLNPVAPPFNDIRVRQYFAREYRKTLKFHFGHSDGSMFTRIMPGYVSLDELDASVAVFSAGEEKSVRSILQKNPPRFKTSHNDIGLEPFKYYFDLTLKRLGIPNPPPESLSKGQGYNSLWSRGAINIGWFYYGFGAVDPTEGLLQMLPKNMFQISNGLSSDNKIQEFVSKINHPSLGNIDVENLKDLSKYLFRESIFAVVANYSFVQFTVKESKLKIVNDWTEDVSNFFTK